MQRPALPPLLTDKSFKKTVMELCSCAGTCEYGNGAPIIKLSAPILRYRTSDDLKVSIWPLGLVHTGRLAYHEVTVCGCSRAALVVPITFKLTSAMAKSRDALT